MDRQMLKALQDIARELKKIRKLMEEQMLADVLLTKEDCEAYAKACAEEDE